MEHPQGIHLFHCLHRGLYVKGLGFQHFQVSIPILWFMYGVYAHTGEFLL